MKDKTDNIEISLALFNEKLSVITEKLSELSEYSHDQIHKIRGDIAALGQIKSSALVKYDLLEQKEKTDYKFLNHELEEIRQKIELSENRKISLIFRIIGGFIMCAISAAVVFFFDRLK